MNSSRQTRDQILGAISESKARKLLEDWANIDPAHLDDGAMRRLVQNHPQAFLHVDPNIFNERFPGRREKASHQIRKRQKFAIRLTSLIATVAVLLRDGWDLADPRRREWCFIRARLAYHVETERLRDTIANSSDHVGPVGTAVEMPKSPVLIGRAGVDPKEQVSFGFLMGLLMLDEVELTSFEAAMYYLQTQLTDKLRRCPNPKCPAPYFFATKKGQKFCSTVCAEPAQREAKRKWWKENRSQKHSR